MNIGDIIFATVGSIIAVCIVGSIIAVCIILFVIERYGKGKND